MTDEKCQDSLSVPMYREVGNKFARKGGRRFALILCDKLPTCQVCDVRLWTNIVTASVEDSVKVFNARTLNGLPAMTRLRDDFDVVAFMGARATVRSKEKWIRRLLTFIRDCYEKTNVKLLGGCFGHQAIAAAFGGQVKANTGGKFILTIENIKSVTRDEPYRLIALHSDEVVKPPKGAKVLATSSTAAVEIFQIEDRVLSFQAHPEIPRPVMLQFYQELIKSGEKDNKDQRSLLSNKPIDKLAFVEDFLYPFLEGKSIKGSSFKKTSSDLE